MRVEVKMGKMVDCEACRHDLSRWVLVEIEQVLMDGLVHDSRSIDAAIVLATCSQYLRCCCSCYKDGC